MEALCDRCARVAGFVGCHDGTHQLCPRVGRAWHLRQTTVAQLRAAAGWVQERATWRHPESGEPSRKVWQMFNGP